MIAAVLPASLMRSMAGAYDNEAVAVFAMCLSFYFWCRSLRAGGGVVAAGLFGALSGLAYFYLVATWGGYIFALNLVGLHAAALVVMGRFTTQVYVAYSLFYAVGTALAVQVPVVGWTPLKSLEQIAPCGVFLAYQLLQYCEVKRKEQNMSRETAWKLRKTVFLGAAAAGVVVVVLIAPSGYFGPLSSRVRGLFVPHTRTGNPLVDSVAEHQKTQNRVYFQYLYHLCTLAPVGFVTVMFHLGDAPSFLLVYGAAAYYFSAKMNRLVLLTGPIGAVLGGILIGRVFSWSVGQIWSLLFGGGGGGDDADKAEAEAAATGGKQKGGGGGKRKKGRRGADVSKTSFSGFVALRDSIQSAGSSPGGLTAKRTLSAVGLLFIYQFSTGLDRMSREVSRGLSSPQVVFKGRRGNEEFIVDDYLDAYKWVKNNTPEDSRILSWWDYGYQINGVANRTTLADGNTWNHEHIALLGKILTGNIDASYAIARHLADYVLVWAGGGGDDVAKSPHLARIANSVYRDHCPDDPTCQMFGRDRNGNPTKMMQDSLLYNLHSYQIRPDAQVDPEKFREVYKSKFGKVRIYEIVNVAKESKEWVADPANKLCDVPGSWYCPGQYPPALKGVLERKKDFAQLEDFNRGKGDDEYQKQYFEGLENPRKVQRKQKEQIGSVLSSAAAAVEGREKPDRDAGSDQFVAPKSTIPSGDGDGADESKPKMNLPNKDNEQSTPIQPRPKPTQEEIDDVYNRWENSEFATLTWQMIKDGEVEKLENWYKIEPLAPFVRSEDGRGPMWWAFENKNQAIVKLLINQGVSHDDADKHGKVPADLLPSD
uniref:dolichyl-diphosphooligosaccharide--protein glycotransferase n=1 Tax=Odontella aurita TaxID=265563 RepID=A0A7S4MYF1_9STRA